MKNYLMMPLLLAVAAFCGCINVTGWRTVHGSGQTVTENRHISNFNRVSVSGDGELTLAQGNDESLSVEADDNLLPYIVSDVKGGQLSLGPQNVNLRSTRPIRYHLTVKDLSALHLSGSVRGEVEHLKTDRLALSISGSGRMTIAQLDARLLSTHISGSGSTRAGGHVQRQEIHISGSGDHLAPELQSAEAEAHISGSGHANLWVDDTLKASISGSGHVEYRGNATVDSHISGSGRVRRSPGVSPYVKI
jgi:hypothetical protein